MACRGPRQEAGVLPQDPAGSARPRSTGVLQAQANLDAGRQAPVRELDGFRLDSVFKRSGNRFASRKRVKSKNPEPRFDSIEAEKAPGKARRRNRPGRSLYNRNRAKPFDESLACRDATVCL